MGANHAQHSRNTMCGSSRGDPQGHQRQRIHTRAHAHANAHTRARSAGTHRSTRTHSLLLEPSDAFQSLSVTCPVVQRSRTVSIGWSCDSGPSSSLHAILVPPRLLPFARWHASGGSTAFLCFHCTAGMLNKLTPENFSKLCGSIAAQLQRVRPNQCPVPKACRPSRCRAVSADRRRRTAQSTAEYCRVLPSPSRLRRAPRKPKRIRCSLSSTQAAVLKYPLEYSSTPATAVLKYPPRPQADHVPYSSAPDTPPHGPVREVRCCSFGMSTDCR